MNDSSDDGEGFLETRPHRAWKRVGQLFENIEYSQITARHISNFFKLTMRLNKIGRLDPVELQELTCNGAFFSGRPTSAAETDLELWDEVEEVGTEPGAARMTVTFPVNPSGGL